MHIGDLINLMLYSLLLAAGQGMFKLAAEQGEASATELGALNYAIHLFRSPIFLAACLLYAISTVLWVALLNRYPLSQAYPLVITISILLTTAIGLFLFNEQLSIEKLLGLLLVSAGVLLLSRSLA
jgi:multidrug transporter EmrE-like cation transporter